MNAGKILVVDDRPENIELIEAFLVEEGYEVITADNGKTALELIESKPVDLVLLDILMPEMDGYEVCREIKFGRKRTELPVIMVTALNAREDKLKSLRAGADDFLSKPIDWTELIARVRSALRLKSTYNELEQQYSRLDHQLELARVVQQELTKVEIPAGLEGEVLYSPVEKIGGDIYDVVEYGRDKYGIFLADSSGHGVPAALIMVMIKLLFVDIKKEELKPAEILQRLNEGLIEHFSRELDNFFVTAVYMEVDRLQGQISWANGGHPRPLLIKPRGKKWRRLTGGETPLGIIKNPGYRTVRTEFQPGSRLFLYTDGLVDLLSAEDSVLEDDIIEESLSLLISGSNGNSFFYERIKKMIAGEEREDDICYLLFTI